MKLPNAKQAIVSESKLRGYLLSTDHTIGRFKARFFAGLCFTDDNWPELKSQLLGIVTNDADRDEETAYGQKYRISGT